MRFQISENPLLNILPDIHIKQVDVGNVIIF